MRNFSLVNKLFIIGCLALIVLIILKVPHEAPTKITPPVVTASTEE